MHFIITLRIALRALAKNKMRAGLTILGIVIGIAAVTTMVSLGQSASALIKGQFEALGTNVIMIFPRNRQRGGVSQSNISLTASDSNAIANDCPSVLAASPIVGAAGQVIYGSSNFSPRELLGVSSQYSTVRNWAITRGEFFSDRDIAGANKVCVIGNSVATALFQTNNPVGEQIRIKNIPFRIVGILERKGANMVGQDQDNIILMPYTTVRKRLHGSEFDNVGAILVSARSTSVMKEAHREIDELLAERHKIRPGDKKDYNVENTDEIARVFGMVTGILTLMLSSIAGISLLVGGVGIMNIMLVSVTERTREIGVRMAVGATSGAILRQFLVEAILLSCIGGLIGFLLGMGASYGLVALINAFTTGTKWENHFSPLAGLIAFLFAACVGVFFGFYPARRASQLDPIDALRYE